MDYFVFVFLQPGVSDCLGIRPETDAHRRDNGCPSNLKRMPIQATDV